MEEKLMDIVLKWVVFLLIVEVYVLYLMYKVKGGKMTDKLIGNEKKYFIL